MMDYGSSTTSYGNVQARQIRTTVESLSPATRKQLAGVFMGQDIAGDPVAQFTLSLLVGEKPRVHLGTRRLSNPSEQPSPVRIIIDKAQKGGVL